jgi:hypothetical protein
MNTSEQNTDAAKAKGKEVEITVVQMEDGRTVEFKGKRNLNKESFLDEGTGQVSVRIDFRNGKTVNFTIPNGGGEGGVDLMAKFAAHGAEQKLGDAAAGAKDVDDAYLSVKDLAERLAGGEWTARTGDGMAGVSVIAKAIAEAKNIHIDTAIAWLKDKNQAQKMALRTSEQLKPIIDRIEKEKAEKNKGKGKGVDTDAMLGELDTIGGAMTSVRTVEPIEA